MPDRIPISESIIYNYWLVILKLLDLGFPWTAIHEMSQADIALVFGIHLATEQRREEQEAASQRQSSGSMNFSNFRGSR